MNNDITQRGEKSVLPWVLGILGVGFLGVLVCCGGFGLLGYFGFSAAAGMLKAPVDAAVSAISSDQELADNLGLPINPSSGFNVTNYNNQNGNGDATVSFDALGSKGSAHVEGQMLLNGGKWSVGNLTVTLLDGTKVQLPR